MWCSEGFSIFDFLQTTLSLTERKLTGWHTKRLSTTTRSGTLSKTKTLITSMSLCLVSTPRRRLSKYLCFGVSATATLQKFYTLRLRDLVSFLFEIFFLNSRTTKSWLSFFDILSHPTESDQTNLSRRDREWLRLLTGWVWLRCQRDRSSDDAVLVCCWSTILRRTRMLTQKRRWKSSDIGFSDLFSMYSTRPPSVSCFEPFFLSIVSSSTSRMWRNGRLFFTGLLRTESLSDRRCDRSRLRRGERRTSDQWYSIKSFSISQSTKKIVWSKTTGSDTEQVHRKWNGIIKWWSLTPPKGSERKTIFPEYISRGWSETITIHYTPRASSSLLSSSSSSVWWCTRSFPPMWWWSRLTAESGWLSPWKQSECRSKRLTPRKINIQDYSGTHQYLKTHNTFSVRRVTKMLWTSWPAFQMLITTMKWTQWSWGLSQRNSNAILFYL